VIGNRKKSVALCRHIGIHTYIRTCMRARTYVNIGYTHTMFGKTHFIKFLTNGQSYRKILFHYCVLFFILFYFIFTSFYFILFSFVYYLFSFYLFILFLLCFLLLHCFCVRDSESITSEFLTPAAWT
jgi:hypothetical protein